MQSLKQKNIGYYLPMPSAIEILPYNLSDQKTQFGKHYDYDYDYDYYYSVEIKVFTSIKYLK